MYVCMYAYRQSNTAGDSILGLGMPVQGCDRQGAMAIMASTWHRTAHTKNTFLELEHVKISFSEDSRRTESGGKYRRVEQLK